MTVLYIVQGFLGAGKSTWSREHARKTQALRLNADEWCAENYTDAELSHDWDGCFGKAVEFLWEEAGRQLKSGRDVILDFGFWTRASRDHARGKAREWNVELRHYFIFAPDEVLIERIGHRSSDIARRNIENFHSLKAGFELPAEDERAIVVDTSTAPKAK